MRADLFELAAHARSYGMPIGFAPSVTPLLTARDGAADARGRAPRPCRSASTAPTPRRTRASAASRTTSRKTEEAVRMLVDEGHTVQINTTVMRRNVEELADVAALRRGLGRAHLGGLLPRSASAAAPSSRSSRPQENEDVVHFLFDASRYGFIVRTVEAPFFRRVVAAAPRGSAPAPTPRRPSASGRSTGGSRRACASVLGEPGVPSRAERGHAGRQGDPVRRARRRRLSRRGSCRCRLGNVRQRRYRASCTARSPLLQAIRRDASSRGRCGACEFADAVRRLAGSRLRDLRAIALGEDPACVYGTEEPGNERATGSA